MMSKIKQQYEDPINGLEQQVRLLKEQMSLFNEVEACADPAVPEPIPCGTKCPRSEGAHKQELLKPDYLHIDDDTRLGSKVDLRTRAGCHRSMYTIGKRFVSFYGLRY